MKFFEIKCFQVGLCDAQYKHIIWMKALLGNKLNEFCLETLCFFVKFYLIETALFD